MISWMLKRIKNWSEPKAYSIAIGMTIVVIFLSLVSLPSFRTSIIDVNNSDKFGHIVAYFSLSLSWLFATRKRYTQVKHRVILACSIIIFGIILEGLQEVLTTKRTADLYDMGANALGVIAATLTFETLRSWLNSMLK